MHAELEQVVVSGPTRGATLTYALFDDRVPRTATDGADPARLVGRFLAGHGPASVRDVARWSSLTLTTVRAALADLGDQLGDDLRSVEVGGETYVHLPPERGGTAPAVLLLPLFDELPLAYRDLAFPPAPGHPRPPGVDLFVGSVFAGDANLGTWRREVKGSIWVEVALDLAPGVPTTCGRWPRRRHSGWPRSWAATSTFAT